MKFGSHLLVDEVMRRWPATIRVFLDFNMTCVGCPIGSFHSVDEACREHGVDCDSFMEALRAVVATYSPPPSAMPNSLCGSRSTIR